MEVIFIVNVYGIIFSVSFNCYHISRDMITIKGNREDNTVNIDDEDYFHRELFWGSFSRVILLPQEIEIEEAEATERHGLLTIKLPKINKDRQTKLRVKAS